jgi:RNA polymerase sigma-70 factor (ECF subfamily)
VAAVGADLVRFDEGELAALRGEVLRHCYRMLGSWDEAEDAVQETYLRAWRGWEGFTHAASVRTWVYRIATNVCLNAVRDRSRRALPSGLGAPTGEPERSEDVRSPEQWISPFPGAGDDLRLALIAGMQTLPPTQRAVLLLRDVLRFRAREVAEMLGMSMPAVKSSLQRARIRLAQAGPAPDDVVEPTDPAARRQLDAYVLAFESADVAGLAAALRADARLELVPNREWYAGKESCLRVLRPAVGRPGDWRMTRTVANAQPAVLAYLQEKPFGVAVLDTRRNGIAGITVFGEPSLVHRFSGSVGGR